MSTGGFASDRGTKMGGVLDITSLSPREKPHVALGLSLLSADLLTDGTFAGGKGQWLLSARRGYLDLALKITGDSDSVSSGKPSFHAPTPQLLLPSNSDTNSGIVPLPETREGVGRRL